MNTKKLPTQEQVLEVMALKRKGLFALAAFRSATYGISFPENMGDVTRPIEGRLEDYEYECKHVEGS